VPGKAGPAGTHRGGGATMVWWGHLRTAVFRWRGGSGDFQWPRGGDPAIRDGGERGGLPVARSERKRSGGTGKASEDGGGTIFKGSGGETAEGV
jgi:hypothetical protein